MDRPTSSHQERHYNGFQDPIIADPREKSRSSRGSLPSSRQSSDRRALEVTRTYPSTSYEDLWNGERRSMPTDSGINSLRDGVEIRKNDERRYRREKDAEAGQLVLYGDRPRSQSWLSPDRFPQGLGMRNSIPVEPQESSVSSTDGSRKISEILAAKPNQHRVRSRSRRWTPIEIDSNYESSSESDCRRSRGRSSTSRGRFSRVNPGMKAPDDEIIRSTLKRLTSFNGEPSFARELRTPARVMSPTQMTSADPSDQASDSGEDQVATLELAKRRLEELMAKQEKATKEDDLMTASDLQFYVIPDLKFRITELTARETRIRKGAGAAASKGAIKTEEAAANAGNAAEVAQGFVIESLGVQSALGKGQGSETNGNVNAVSKPKANGTDEWSIKAVNEEELSSSSSMTEDEGDGGEINGNFEAIGPKELLKEQMTGLKRARSL